MTNDAFKVIQPKQPAVICCVCLRKINKGEDRNWVMGASYHSSPFICLNPPNWGK